MLGDITRHLTHYVSLFTLVVFTFWGLSAFTFDKTFQSAIVISFATSFVVWGVIHHHLHEDLHPKIIIEYIASALLGATVLLSVIW